MKGAIIFIKIVPLVEPYMAAINGSAKTYIMTTASPPVKKTKRNASLNRYSIKALSFFEFASLMAGTRDVDKA